MGGMKHDQTILGSVLFSIHGRQGGLLYGMLEDVRNNHLMQLRFVFKAGVDITKAHDMA